MNDIEYLKRITDIIIKNATKLLRIQTKEHQLQANVTV